MVSAIDATQAMPIDTSASSTAMKTSLKLLVMAMRAQLYNEPERSRRYLVD